MSELPAGTVGPSGSPRSSGSSATTGSGEALSVLLVSPVRGVDPLSGDVTYTETLLASPPRGVRYTTYVEALAEGSMVEHGRRRSLEGARHPEGGLAVEASLLGTRQIERVLRASGVAFREPFRYFSVDPDRFDLVHAHVFSIRLLGRPVPLVVSSAGPLRLPYRDAWGWSSARVTRAEWLDRAMSRLTGVNEFSGRCPQADAVITFSQLDRARRLDEGLTGQPIHVVPNASTPAPRLRARPGPLTHVGFVATDFDAKGGDRVLAAFDLLRASRPDLRLTIVGSPPRLSRQELERRGIEWIDRVDHERLRNDLIPDFDVFVYPTRFDGLPYVVIEALSAGVPVVSSDYGALPELVGPDAGRVVRGVDAEAIVRATLELLDPETNEIASAAALDRFARSYSTEVVGARLGAVYASVGSRTAEPRP